jgi:serine/threonine protein kinase
LILEWIEGTSFLDHARSLDLRSKLLLFCDICSVIEAAHRLLVVHRDLKPAHILITPQGNLKILDFGIAKLIQSTNSTDSQLTQYGQAPLTPAYASAEQWRGDPATPSFDVFSLGVLFAELLTGNHPFGASPALPHEWASRIAAGQPVGLTGLKADLRAIAAMAIEQNPSQRYLSVEAFRRDIENYLDHKPLALACPQ